MSTLRYGCRATNPVREMHGGMFTEPTEKRQAHENPLTLDEMITLQEAAEYSGLTKGSLYNYIKSGRLKARRIGWQWLTTYAAVDEYLSSRSFDNIPKKYRNRS